MLAEMAGRAMLIARRLCSNNSALYYTLSLWLEPICGES